MRVRHLLERAPARAFMPIRCAIHDRNHGRVLLIGLAERVGLRALLLASANAGKHQDRDRGHQDAREYRLYRRCLP
jgi:hypothetical protein